MSAYEYETLTVEPRGQRAAVLWMDRPGKLNAMSQTMLAELPQAMAELDADPELGVCVLAGRGKAFSAGGDIADFERLDGPGDYRMQVNLALSAFSSLETCQTPVLAAVAGIAFGGGTEITLACDYVIAAPSARFAFKEVTLGLMPGYGLLRGPDVIGRPWTTRLALTGDELGPEQALAIGLVQELAGEEELLDHAVALAQRIGRNSPVAIAAGKRMLNERVGPAGLAGAIEATALLQATPETRAAVAEFVAARAPGRAAS